MNGIEKEIGDRADLVRVNLLNPCGKAVGKRFNVESAGTLIVLNKQGNEIYRHTGFPSKEQVLSLVNDDNG